MIFKKKYFKKHGFEEKIIFKKHDFEKNLHTKNHVLRQFNPLNAQILHFTCIFKKQDFEEKRFFFLKSTILNEKVFVKSTILK